MMKLRAIGVIALSAGVLMAACSPSRNKSVEPTPTLRIDLSAYGLPKDFFQVDADTKCAHQIIGYRFVVWPNNETVAVGFNTSPNCRPSPSQRVRGIARILLFNTQGAPKASRDLPYDADGGKVLVAPGEGGVGPGGTVLFRIEEAGESKSAILLLDANLKDAARIDRFLEQTTLVDHALVFQEGVVWSGPRTYDTFDGYPLVQTRKKEELWPVGTMDRKFGEHGVAYMLCQQELRPNEWVSDNVVYANARRRCRMVAEPDGQASWEVPLKDEGTAVIVGILADGSVVGQVPVKGRKDRQLVIWKKDQQMEILPWIAPNYCGAVDSATADMSRYATFAAEDCDGDAGRWVVFDRTSQTAIADRLFPRNGRAALSPDGLRYASFEAGELRIYTLPTSVAKSWFVLLTGKVLVGSHHMTGYE
jgi:hypothetical protein